MQTTIIIIGLLIVSFGIFIFIARARIRNIPLVADNDKILILSEANFQHQTKNKIVLVDFWASWCAPCRIMAPVLNDIADQLSGKAHVGKVNIEQFQFLARKYNIRSIPTLILFKNNIEVKRYVGVKSKEFLLQQINNA